MMRNDMSKAQDYHTNISKIFWNTEIPKNYDVIRIEKIQNSNCKQV